MKRGTRGMGRVYQRGSIWWVTYSHNGTKHRESSGSTKRPVAVALLKRRFEELGKGRPAREAERVLLTDLRALIEGDYQLNGLRSAKRLKQSWAHLAAFFGERETAISITPPRLALYVTSRIDEGSAPATVKNELAALKRAFTLARKSGTLLPNEVPAGFPTIAPSAPRSGFFERAEHEAVRAALPSDLADLVQFLYLAGWRKSEALGLRWQNVDESARVIRIETTKNKEPRTLPYGTLPALRELIETRRGITDEVQKARGMVVTHVFARNGEPIRYLRRSWITACITAGLGTEERDQEGRVLKRVAFRTPHDYRRSAARNLSRAGVPESVIMALCGWRTRSVFLRYRIVPEYELAEGLAKLARTPAAKTTRKVTRMKARKRGGSS